MVKLETTPSAGRVDVVLPGVVHWTVQDMRIDFRGDAYGVDCPEGQVLIDPLPLGRSALKSLGKIALVCMTAGQHQRACWQYRRDLGVPVHAPAGATELHEEPDAWFSDGEVVAGCLRAVSTPGCGAAHFVFVLDGKDEGRVLFSGDLVIRDAEGPFLLVPDYYVTDPAQVRASVLKMIGMAPVVLCPSHGAPQVGGAEKLLRDAFRRAPGA
jgi:glyoxylase-like metal-dependent hydrolase (beta-lactamase superfamily II)